MYKYYSANIYSTRAGYSFCFVSNCFTRYESRATDHLHLSNIQHRSIRQVYISIYFIIFQLMRLVVNCLCVCRFDVFVSQIFVMYSCRANAIWPNTRLIRLAFMWFTAKLIFFVHCKLWLNVIAGTKDEFNGKMCQTQDTSGGILPWWYFDWL